MMTYKVTQGPHYDADMTMVVPEPYSKQFSYLFLAKGIMSYRQIISNSIYVSLEGTCSLTSQALLNTGE